MKGITSEKGNDLLKEKDSPNGIRVRRENGLRTAFRGGKEKERKKRKKKKDVLGVPEESRRKEVGLRARGGTGAAARSLRTDRPGKLQGGPGEGQVGHPGCRMSRRGRTWERQVGDPAKPGREARGRLPSGRQTPPAGSEGRPSAEGGRSARLSGRVGGTLTNFLGLPPPSPPVAGSSSGLRPFFLSRVPRPGPWPPPDGSMSWLAPATDPLATPLAPGCPEPATTAAAPQPS